MGVIQRFAVSSMVLGVLAMAGGASAIAFESGESPAVQPGQTSDVPSNASADVSSDVPADNASDVLPETGGSDASWNWFTPRGR